MRAAPRADPYVRNYLIRLLPRVVTIVASVGTPPCHARTLCDPMPRSPGSVSGASKVRLAFLLVGPLPSADSVAAGIARCSFLPALFARFSGTMRPSDSLETCMSGYGSRLPRPSHVDKQRGSPQGLPVPVQRVSTHAQGLRLRGVVQWLASFVTAHVAFPSQVRGRHAGELISELNGWPACAPVNASPTVSPPPAHDSGSGWIAGPFPCGSFIRDSLPVYPGAIRSFRILSSRKSGGRHMSIMWW